MVEITVAPDPSRPHGGYARLSVPADRLGETEVPVVVFDVFSGRYLGEDGFQGERTLFGPYPVARDGDSASVVIGPEIVNQLEDVVSLEIEIGPVKGPVSWPDDVIPAVGAARLGGIVTGPALETSTDDANLVGQMPTDDEEASDTSAEDDEDAGTETTEELGTTDAEPQQGPTRNWAVWAGVAAVILAMVAGGAWFLMQQDDPVTEPVAVSDPPPPEPIAEPAPSVVTSACAAADIAPLSALPFAEARAALEACGAEAETEAAFRVLEQAATSGDPQALLLFGQTYDAEVTVPIIETDMQLSLGDQPARAAEYYHRALRGGATEAAELLSDVCQRLEGSTNTIDQAARQEYCS